MADRNTLGQFEIWASKLPRAELGGLLKEYVAESNHGSWEGFTSADLTGIKRFLEDLMRYHTNSGESFATKITSTNLIP